MSVANATASRRTKIGPNLFQRGKRYYLIANIRGRQVFEALSATTKTEAKAERDQRMAEIAAERRDDVAAFVESIGDRTLTFDQLAAKYVEHERGPSGKLTKRTCDLREVLLHKHVSPVLGAIKAASIRTAHVQALADRLTKAGLSGSSVRGIVTSVACVMKYGARYGYVSINPCREVTLPSAARTTEPRYLEPSEVQAILDKLGNEFRPVAAACYFAALRVSEALALTWDCVDFDKGRIDVRAGKTKASVNSAPLPLPLAKILRKHRQLQVEAGRFEIGGLVFTTATGKPQSRRNALRAVNLASKAVGLWSEEDGREPVGLHDLRHSAASFYFKQGLRTREVSRLLRHANAVVTQTVYGGIAPQEDEEILDGAVMAFGTVGAAL
jgi:integrase